jgi:penicillin amidase
MGATLKTSRILKTFVTALAAGLLWGQDSASSLRTRAQAALAQTSGTVELRGLQKPVQVLRDRWGVAHIYAQNQRDLFFAQGFIAAQDRLFQMELWKRSGQGRLAELLGQGALQRDIYARLLRYRGEMKAEYESYSPDTREILKAFTNGINAYIETLTGPGGRGLPLEFQAAGFSPEPWKPEDCLNRMAAFSMTGNAFTELAHAEAIAALGTERATSLFDFDPPVMLDPAPGISFTGLSTALLKNLVGSDVRIEFPAHRSSADLSPAQFFPADLALHFAEGSNNWTVSGKLTRSGKPLLANDPHRVIAEPSLRYMVHLVAPGWNVIGAGEPGLPGVALGHNQHIAWGFTIFGLDQQDLYVEELNPEDPLQYRVGSVWQGMETRREKFAIKGAPDAEVELKFTRHGPVLWEDGKRALALRWVGEEPGTAGYLGSLAVDCADDWTQFEAAMARWKVPSENIVYADTKGNIGEHSTGLAPFRRNWTGLLPVPGAGGYEWDGFVPNGELPHSFNPENGFIATANHKMIPAAYPYKVGYEWVPPYRIQRISHLLADSAKKGSKLDVADMGKIQTDVFSLPAQELLGLLRGAEQAQRNANAEYLLAWDGTLARESGQAALYEVWIEQLTRTLKEKIVPSAQRIGDWSMPMILKLLEHPTSSAFGENAAANRDRMLVETLDDAAKALEKLQGSGRKNWSWGALHTVHFRHPLDQMEGIAVLTDLGPLPRPGDEYTVNATGSPEDSLVQAYGASYREILDLSDWDQSLAVNTPGQSGQPGSPHYGDLSPLWDRGEYFPLVYSREAVEKAAGAKMTLEPGR